jgi:hypothetical protein
LFNHLRLNLVGRLFDDLLQIFLRRTTVWAIDCYPTITFFGEIL